MQIVLTSAKKLPQSIVSLSLNGLVEHFLPVAEVTLTLQIVYSVQSFLMRAVSTFESKYSHQNCTRALGKSWE